MLGLKNLKNYFLNIAKILKPFYKSLEKKIDINKNKNKRLRITLSLLLKLI